MVCKCINDGANDFEIALATAALSGDLNMMGYIVSLCKRKIISRA